MAVLPMKAATPRPFQARPLQLSQPLPTLPPTMIPLKPEDWWMVPTSDNPRLLPPDDFRTFKSELDSPGPGYRAQSEQVVK